MARTILTANQAYSVPTDFATPQAAWDHIFKNLDLAGYTVTVNIANGTYGLLNISGAVLGSTGPGAVQFIGNLSSSVSVVFSVTNSIAISIANEAAVTLRGISAGSTNGIGISVNGGRLNIGDSCLNACGAAQLDAANPRSIVQLIGPLYINGNSPICLLAETGAILFMNQCSISPVAFGLNFSNAFCLSSEGAMIDFTGTTFDCFSLPVTGAKWKASGYGQVKGTAAANALLGNAAGSGSTGGQYL